MYRIEQEKDSKYKKLKLDYTYGFGTIYDVKEIERKKLDPEFKREYCCMYEGKIGNIFSPTLIDKAIANFEQVKDIPIVHEALHIVGIDPAFGSSKFGIVLTEHLKSPDIVRVLFAEEYEKAVPDDMINLLYDFHRKYYPNIRFYCDGANAGFIRQLRVTFGENPDYDYKSINPDTDEIIPVAFSVEHKQMLSHLYMMINDNYLAISPKHEKLIISLRTAVAKEYTLDKQATSYDDLLDAQR